jgi:hypothetical protein
MPDMKPGPVLNEAVDEIQGIFPNDAALQAAMGKLCLAGFDRAALSLPAASPHQNEATPEAGAADPVTEDDTRQMRTMGSSVAATAGALIGAGVTVATGGAAGVAIAAAVGLGAITGGAAMAATGAARQVGTDQRAASAASGTLVLAVRAEGAADSAKAEAAMYEAGAVRVEKVRRIGGAIA